MSNKQLIIINHSPYLDFLKLAANLSKFNSALPSHRQSSAYDIPALTLAYCVHFP
jgi:hypothetical protein